MYMRTIRTLLTISGLAVVLVVITTRGQNTDNTAFASTAQNTVTETAYPVPSTAPVPGADSAESSEAQIAQTFIAQRENLALAHLHIVTEFQYDAPLLGRRFQALTIADDASGQVFPVLVDRESGQVEDREAIADAERAAQRGKYGKLQPALYEQLQQLQDGDVVTVMIRLADGPGQSYHERADRARAAVAAKYPEAQAAVALNRKPMEVDDPALASRIYEEYIALLHDLSSSMPHQNAASIDGIPRYKAGWFEAGDRIIMGYKESQVSEVAS